ncbi:hypothetical protein [Luteimonas sp. e5]
MKRNLEHPDIHALLADFSRVINALLEVQCDRDQAIAYFVHTPIRVLSHRTLLSSTIDGDTERALRTCIQFRVAKTANSDDASAEAPVPRPSPAILTLPTASNRRWRAARINFPDSSCFYPPNPGKAATDGI